MANETKFSKDNQPKNRRGKSERTKLLEAFKKEGKTEEGFYQKMVELAFNSEDNFARSEVFKRIYPVTKAIMPTSEWEFPIKGTPLEKADAIYNAISKGKLPPDVGLSLISSLTNLIKIEEVTEIKRDLEEIKEKLGLSDV